MNGSRSYDPETKDNEGMRFTWRYGTTKGTNIDNINLLKQGSFAALNNSNIQNLGNASGLVVTIDTKFFRYNETVVVKLTVTKDYRVSSAFQVVHFVRGDSPKILQR